MAGAMEGKVAVVANAGVGDSAKLGSIGLAQTG